MKKAQPSTEYFETNHLRQYLLHTRSNRPDAPVMLLVHGGPGGPDSNTAYQYQIWWQDLFHLISWDQRGCGKTLAANGQPPAYPVTVPELLCDMHGIIEHIKTSYGVDRIFVFGHSWGTVLGTLYTLEHPENVAAYIGAGQFCNFFRNEIAAYAKTKEVVEAAGSRRDLAKLESILPYPDRPMDPDSVVVKKKMPVLKRLQARYNIAGKVTTELIRIYLRSPAFRISDFSMFSKKAAGYSKDLLRFVFDFEILDCGVKYEAPVFYILGDRDYQTAAPVAMEYFESIEAPLKQLFLLPDAGHGMMYDQPEAFAQALNEIITLVGWNR